MWRVLASWVSLGPLPAPVSRRWVCGLDPGSPLCRNDEGAYYWGGGLERCRPCPGALASHALLVSTYGGDPVCKWGLCM